MSKEDLAQKLHPRKFTAMSGKMAAIVGYVLDQDWTSPGLAEMAITSDGFVLARRDGDIGCNEWIGDVGDLERNVHNLLDAAELSQDERTEWQRLFQARVTDWRNGHNPRRHEQGGDDGNNQS
jgi:hypothetical protein